MQCSECGRTIDPSERSIRLYGFPICWDCPALGGAFAELLTRIETRVAEVTIPEAWAAYLMPVLRKRLAADTTCPDNTVV